LIILMRIAGCLSETRERRFRNKKEKEIEAV
jgi:hypothetical protein